jgi:hypothetical protein
MQEHGEGGVVREVRERTAAAAPAREHERRSLGGLLLELTKESSALVRAEVTLARLEIEEKLSEVQHGVSGLAVGGLVTFAGVLTLIACAVLALSSLWPAWQAALVVGLGVFVIGLCLVAYGRSRVKARRLRPRRVMETLRDSKEFVKEQAS